MSESATNYVDEVNKHFRALVTNPIDKVFEEFDQACLTGVLDPDVVDVFNRESDYFDYDFLWLSASIDTKTPQGDFIFQRNGYTAIARRSGITAVHSALVHTGEPMTPDPVEALYPGYSNMALRKAGRAVMPASHGWSSLGHATGVSENTRIPERKFAGSTGSLFMFEEDGMRDIRLALLEVPEIAKTITDENPIDLIAGLADEERAIAAITGRSERSLGEIYLSAKEHIRKGDYLH